MALLTSLSFLLWLLLNLAANVKAEDVVDELFAALDTDADGSISPSELRIGMRVRGDAMLKALLATPKPYGNEAKNEPDQFEDDAPAVCDDDTCPSKQVQPETEVLAKPSSELSSAAATEFKNAITYFRKHDDASSEEDEVGKSFFWKSADGRQLPVKILNMNPFILEVDTFLTAKECDVLRKAAEKEGLTNSQLDAPRKMNELTDFNEDKVINVTEMKATLHNAFGADLDHQDVKRMFKKLGMDRNGDEQIDLAELGRVQPQDVHSYVEKMWEREPWKRTRWSDSAVLDTTGKDMTPINSRILDFVGLKSDLVGIIESQVARYGKHGHYSFHMDSDDNKLPLNCCSDYGQKPGAHGKCRICRLVTALYYLSDVDDGGATVFPLAGEVDWRQSFDLSRWKSDQGSAGGRFCTGPVTNGSRSSPSKGKAVIWFNHGRWENKKSTRLGPVDVLTTHAGCPVRKGVKWVLNHWVSVKK